MKRLSLLFAALLVAGLIWYKNRPSDEAQIKSLITELTRSASFENDDSKLMERLEWASTLARSVTDPCTVTILFESEDKKVLVLTRKEVTQHLVALRQNLAQIAFTLVSPIVEVKDDTALVRGTGRGMGRSPGREDYFLESHEVEIHLTKESGEWKISSLKNLEPIATE